MENEDFLKHVKILAWVTLASLILTIILPIYNQPFWPISMLYSCFIAELTLRSQAKIRPEIDVSWRAIYQFVYESNEKRLGMASPATILERYFNKLRTEVPTVYYAEAIPRFLDIFPESLQSEIERAQLRYAAIIGIEKTGLTAVDIMKDRSDYPEFVRPNEAGKSQFSEECIKFSIKATGIPDLLVRIVIIGSFLKKRSVPYLMGDTSRLEVVRNLRNHGSITNTALAKDYLIKLKD